MKIEVCLLVSQSFFYLIFRTKFYPGGEKPDTIDGTIQFENVCFAYPSRPDAGILNNLTFKIEKGKTVAIVGGSGSGKSTIAQLLMKFYDPTEGRVFIGGYPLSGLDASFMRQKHIGLVGQEPVLFAASIRDNIRYGKPDASDEEVIDAARQANADGFIMSFPDGYDTFCGERGSALSGGYIIHYYYLLTSEFWVRQKQRLAIARALLKNPQILLLDEATSVLQLAAAMFKI